MSIVKESFVEQQVKNYVDRIGGLAIKLGNSGVRGWPDQLFLLPNGRPLFIEFKRPDVSKGRKLQVYRIERLCALGFPAHLVNSVEKGIEIVNFYNNQAGMDTALIPKTWH
jgi:hypothetical protein